MRAWGAIGSVFSGCRLASHPSWVDRRGSAPGRPRGKVTDEQPHANAKGPAPIVRPVNYQARRQELESKVSDLSSSLNEFQEAPVEIRQEVAATLRPIVAWYEELT